VSEWASECGYKQASKRASERARKQKGNTQLTGEARRGEARGGTARHGTGETDQKAVPGLVADDELGDFPLVLPAEVVRAAPCGQQALLVVYRAPRLQPRAALRRVQGDHAIVQDSGRDGAAVNPAPTTGRGGGGRGRYYRRRWARSVRVRT